MRRNWLKKCISTAAMLTAVSLLVTGCGSDDGKQNSSAVNGESQGGKELIYWSMWNSTEGQAKVIQEAADKYEKETGIHINIEWKGRDIKKLVGPALDSGEKIDFFDNDYVFLSQQCNKYLADLTEMSEAVGYEEHALPVLIETTKSYTDNILKVIPYQPYTTGVWYNKDLFDKAGIKETPKTFNEFLDVCEKLKNADIVPMTCDAGDGTAMLVGYQLGRYIGEDGVIDVVNNATWAQVPQAKQAAEDIYTLFDKGYMSEYAPAQYPNGQNEIGFEDTAMILQASWVPNEIIQNTGSEVNWGFFPWPTVEGGTDGIEASMIGAQGFGIVDKSDNKQEAFDFIQTVVTGEFDAKMAQSVSSIPADVKNTDWPKSVSGAEPYFKDMTKAYSWVVGLQDNTDYKEFIQSSIDRLCKKEITPDKFISELSGLKK